ncbi:MAG: hypothetical protein ACXVLQ_06830 [Bacteriovorax sp.]
MQGRRRFIKTPPLRNQEEWLAELGTLKDFLFKETHLQIVGSKTYLEFSNEGLALMLQVLGVPPYLEQKALELVDLEASPVLVYQWERDLFQVDFDELFLTSRSILGGLAAKGEVLSAVYHIVFDDEKIELHFFRQKDYIQTLL